MDCINCGSNKNVSILKGVFICEHCDKTNFINYYRCEDCQETWKVVDLGVAEQVNLEQSSNLFEEDGSSCFGELHTIPLMMGYIHKCLMCNAISYEKEENVWHCPECGFEWETISCG